MVLPAEGDDNGNDGADGWGDVGRKGRKERKDMAGVKILLVTSVWHMKRARLMFVALHEWVGIVGYTIFR